MNKRMGTAIGLVLTAVGVGIPSAAVASSNNVAMDYTVITNTSGVTDTANQGWTHGDEYAFGVDPFARTGEATTPWSATAVPLGSEALPDAGPATAQGVSPSYALGTAEAGAYVDEYGVIIEPPTAWQPELAGAASRSTHGLTRVEPSALGINEQGLFEQARPALETRGGSETDAYQFVPVGSVETTSPWSTATPLGAEALPDVGPTEGVRVSPSYALGTAEPGAYVDDYGVVIEPPAAWQPERVSAASRSTHGLTRVEPSALGINEQGILEQARPAIEGSGDLETHAYGFDPYGGTVENWPGSAR